MLSAAADNRRCLFRRSRCEHLALTARFGFRLGLGRLLGFFLAFIFASHDPKHDTADRTAKSPNRARPVCQLSPLVPLFLVRRFRSRLRQVVIIQNRVEHQSISTDGFAAVDGVIAEQQHVARAQMRVHHHGMLGDGARFV